MLDRVQILMNRDKEYPIDAVLEANLAVLLEKINKLQVLCPIKFKVTSGYRPGKYNVLAGGAKKSSHLTCEAVDLADKSGVLKAWCVKNIDKLNEIGLYMEDPARTPSWVHLQTRKTKGNPFKI